MSFVWNENCEKQPEELNYLAIQRAAFPDYHLVTNTWNMQH